MQNKIAIAMLTMTAAMSSAALGNEIIPFEDPNILNDCGCGGVSVEWVSGDGDAPGTLSWLNPDLQNTPVELFNSETAAAGDEVFLPRSYSFGERIDFSYAVNGEAPVTLRTDIEGNWGQFYIEQESSSVYLVRVEDDPSVFTDDDMNDAVFRVEFCSVPAPGASVLLGAGLSMMGLRRRR